MKAVAAVKAAVETATVETATVETATVETTTVETAAPTTANKQHFGWTARRHSGEGGPGRCRSRDHGRQSQNWKNSHDNLLSCSEVGDGLTWTNSAQRRSAYRKSGVGFCPRPQSSDRDRPDIGGIIPLWQRPGLHWLV
jgi:hypothetical protein